MPDATIAAPPAAAPAAPAAPSPNAAPPKPAASPAPASPKTSAVRTPASTIGKTSGAPAEPAKVENPFDKANADLAKFADPDEDEPRPPGAEKAPPKPAKGTKPPEEKPEAELEEEAKPGDDPNPEDKLDPDEKSLLAKLTGKSGKVSPWKLKDYWKGVATKLEADIAELRSNNKPGELPKEHQEKFAAIEARNKELEDEIRHVNYSKSKEFVDLYQKPYEDAWQNAISDLKELTIENDDGTSRAATAHDMIALANMPLGEARRTAKQWFGDSADDVMAHRRAIVDLSGKQTKALEESKTKGGEREQQRTAEMQAKMKARSEENAKVWHAVNEEAVAKYDYLRPVEGETERNTKLEKAKAFVDDTMKKSVNQAKTAEERDQILRSHAAVRNRAIGFSVLKHENVSLKAKLAELEKSLAEFQESEPTAGGLQNQPGSEGGGDEMAGAMSRLTSSRYVT